MTKTGEAAKPAAVAVEPESFGEMWAMYQKQILVGAVVVVTGVAGWWLYQRSAEIREERAGAAYQAAEVTFMTGNSQLAQPELEKIVGRYSGTAAGTQAAMLLAQAYFEQGKADSGIAVLQGALRGAPRSLRAGVEALIGAGQEALGKPGDAAAAYGRAAAAAEFQMDKDMHLVEQARNLAQAGDTAGATGIYESLAAREDSPFAGEARIRLGELRSTSK